MIIKVNNSIKVVLAVFFCFIFSVVAQAQVAESVVFQEPQVFEKQQDLLPTLTSKVEYEEPVVNCTYSFNSNLVIADANKVISAQSVSNNSNVNGNTKIVKANKNEVVKKVSAQNNNSNKIISNKKKSVAKNIASSRAAAQDRQATKVYQKGFELYQNKEYYDAISYFKEAEFLASSAVVKANCVRAQIGAWRMCNFLYNEFLAIEKMLSLYAEYADFSELLKREYEIGTLFARGHRDPEYWALRFIPWLKGPNRSSEVFAKALKRAPFAPEAAAARLHLAYLYDQEDNISKSIAQLRILIKDYPGTKEYRYALLALAESLFELAKGGDGDGSLAKEAYDVLLKFQSLYPNDSENHWVNKMITYYKDGQAKRLMAMAKFYERSGKKDVAARYLAQVLKEYPNSLSSDDAEKKLANLDKTYLVTSFNDKTNERRTFDYRVYSIPKEAKDVLIYPGDNNNYLLPIYDLKVESQDAKNAGKVIKENNSLPKTKEEKK